jgi:hypothetical protein
MKATVFAAIAVAGLAACTVNSNNTHPTSWGKEGVSKLDYQTDGILCATLAERATPDNGAKSAGGINGSNNTAQTCCSGGANAGAAAGPNSSLGSLSGNTYRDTASPDLVSRAANQQISRDMRLKQLRVDSLRSCLVDRGYTEFQLTAEQQAKLATLAPGSEARTDFLYKLGTDPQILKTAAVTRPPPPPAGAPSADAKK